MQQKENTFRENMETTKQASFFPALMAMVSLRQRLGLRTVNGTALGIMSAIVVIIGQLCHSGALTAYGVIVWAVGSWQGWKRWQEIRLGEAWHTRSHGISPLEYLPWLPEWFRHDARIYRFADPVVVLLTGLVASCLDKPLGMWLCFSAVALRIFEEHSFDIRMGRLLDQYDNLIVAQDDNQFMQRVQAGIAQLALPEPSRDMADAPTSDEDYLRGLIALRELEAACKPAAGTQ